MKKISDLVGLRFNRLIVLEFIGVDKNRNTQWLCQCDCGTQIITTRNSLLANNTKSCGCLRIDKCKKHITAYHEKNINYDLTGRIFGKLKVTRFAYSSNNKRYWYCACECGNEKVVNAVNLTRGNSKTCGCSRKKGLRLKHGHDRKGKMTPTYKSWASMKERCTNPNCDAYWLYGGAGICISDQWINSFETFLEDMGERPKGTSLDRYPDAYGNYEPGNCRWATRKEQANNRRKNIFKELKTHI